MSQETTNTQREFEYKRQPLPPNLPAPWSINSPHPSMPPMPPSRLPSGQMDVNLQVGPPPGSSIERYYEQMLRLMPTPRQQGLGNLGSILGGFAGDQRTNRVIQGNAQQGYDQMMLDREQARNTLGNTANTDFDRTSLLARADKRDSNLNAIQNAMLGAHLQRGDRTTDARTGKATYTADPQEAAAATGIIQQAHDNIVDPGYQPTRFEGSWGYQPMDPSKYAKPGIMEKIGQYGGMASGLLGGIDALTGGNKIGGWLGSIGKGAALGTKLGTVVPGIGNLVGGALGGIGGGLMKLFGR